jgi:hypothetical protein
MRRPRSVNDAERERSARRRDAKFDRGECAGCPAPLDGWSRQFCRACLDRRRGYLARIRGYQRSRVSRMKRLEAA